MPSSCIVPRDDFLVLSRDCREWLLAGGPRKSRTDIHITASLPVEGAVTSGMRQDCDIALMIAPMAAANQPASQPVSQSQPASQPASQLASTPASQPASHPANQPTSQPANQPASQLNVIHQPTKTYLCASSPLILSEGF